MVPMLILKGITRGRSCQGFLVGGKFLCALGETSLLLAYYNNLEKNTNNIYAITPKGLVNLELPKIHYKVQFHLVTRQCGT